MTSVPDEQTRTRAPGPARAHGHVSPLVFGMATCQIVGWGATYHALPAFVAPMREELGWTATQINGAFTLAFVVCDLVSIPAGQWFDRRGGRAMMTLGGVLLAAMLAAWSRVTDLVALYLVFAVIGIAQGMALNNLAFAAVTANVRDFRRGLNVLTLVSGLSPSVALPVAGVLISGWGWRAALSAMAAIALVGVTAMSFLVLRGTVGSQSHETAEERAALPSPLGEAMRGRTFWLLVIAFSIHWFSNAGFAIHGLPMFEEWGQSTGSAIFLMALFGPAQVIARLAMLVMWPDASGRLIGRVMWLAFAAATIFLAVFGRASYAALLLFVIAYGAASGVMVIARVTVIAEIYGVRGYGAISGAIATCSIIARTGAPLLLALAHDALGGYVEVTQGLALLAVIGALAFFAATSRARGPSPAGLAQN